MLGRCHVVVAIHGVDEYHSYDASVVACASSSALQSACFPTQQGLTLQFCQLLVVCAVGMLIVIQNIKAASAHGQSCIMPLWCVERHAWLVSPFLALLCARNSLTQARHSLKELGIAPQCMSSSST